MSDLLSNPAVQGGVAPFVAGLIVTVLLGRFRLGGLAVAAAFATAVYFIAGFNFTPLSATRKIILLGLAAPVVGIVVDFVFRRAWVGSPQPGNTYDLIPMEPPASYGMSADAPLPTEGPKTPPAAGEPHKQ